MTNDNTNPSETPRTDALLETSWSEIEILRHARTLERELSAAKKEVEELKKQLSLSIKLTNAAATSETLWRKDAMRLAEALLIEQRMTQACISGLGQVHRGMEVKIHRTNPTRRLQGWDDGGGGLSTI